MNRLLVLLISAVSVPFAYCGQTQLICHRTANADMPENTLESLALAARMGCNVVEIDLTRTLDGKIVLHHDGLLERLSNGMGVVEETYSQELALLDAGSWMGSRFGVMRIPSFEDALSVAKEQNISLILDMKSKGMGAQVISILRRESMLDRVRFGGEWDDVKAIYPQANAGAEVSLPPGATRDQIDAAHHDGKFVIVNFFANHHEMDLQGMRAAVASGADAIFVDYPRLGADAVGRPVESRLAALVTKADTGATPDRAAAILEISQFDGFPTESLFLHWLLDNDDRISRAAAIALVTSHPHVQQSSLEPTLVSSQTSARKNAAWAIGMVRGQVSPSLLNLLNDKDPTVLQETLLALSRCSGEVPAEKVLPFLSNPSPLVRGAAALALVRHQPQVAATAVPATLDKDEQLIANDYAHYVERGKPKLTQQEIDPIVLMYRGQMKLVQAGEQLPAEDALAFLQTQAFRSVEDYSLVAGLVAGYQLWDRVGADPTATIRALAAKDIDVANRAEWILVKAGPSVLPAVRAALATEPAPVRDRCIEIVAWQGDLASLPLLKAMAQSPSTDTSLINWAIDKINTLSFAVH